MSRATLGPRMPTPFRLVPEAASVQIATVEPLTFPHYIVQMAFVLIPDVEEVQTPYDDVSQTPDAQYILLGDKVLRQLPPIVARLIEGTSAPDEVLRIPTSFNLLLGRPWIYRAEAIPYSLHQKVKFIHDGQTLEMEDFCRDFIAMSFDQHSSTVVLDMMKGMSYLADMGLGQRQHGPNEFMTFPDYDVPFRLGFIPTEADYRYMARLRRERVRARLTHTPFDYPIRSYTLSLMDYFIFDIDDEIVQHDLDDDSSSVSDLDPMDQSVSPATGDTELVDFSTVDQPRELRIRSDLSTDERDSLIQDHTWTFSHGPMRTCRALIHLLSNIICHFCPMPDRLFDVVIYGRIFRVQSDSDGSRGHGEDVLYYRVRLKNTRATYQRTATTLFHDMMHQDVECQRAFERIREYLLSPSVLAPPTPGRHLVLYLLVSDVALGCMLAQLDDSSKKRAIYYLSKRMLDYETRYVMIERYCLALNSIRGSIVVDHLASLPIFDGRAIDDDFPNEDVATVTSLSGWCMYFDGAAKHFGYGIGVLLISPHGDHILRYVRLAFSDRHPAMNNIVEYEACILGLETAFELEIRQMEVFGDFNMVLRQIQGKWKTKDMKLRPYHAYLELLVRRFDDLRYTHLPRAQNQFADALATLASMIDIPADASVRPLLIKLKSVPAYCCLIDDTKIDDVWGIDIIGKISLKSSNSNEFILVAIDYFTKWVEVALYARLTSVGVASFIRSHIICRYGVPHELISDRGVHFRAEVDTIVQRYDIWHHRSSAYRP
uniref:Integrase catalytic domain-containing protein n=1 Tax=Vitis vinifera TaxID=29760 RepID=A5AGC8_VITVI|nr:hypothetical protein VITISV_012872 [Vitis vinifera]